MKQGKARIDGPYDRKVEPSANGINPGWVGQLGESQGSHVTSNTESSYRGEQMHKKRGYSAPMNVSQSSTNCGSQGKH